MPLLTTLRRLADQAYADLRSIWRHVDADLPVLAEVARQSAQAR
jgi:hypothetical protein